MKKALHIGAKALFSIILIMPILGTLGIFPPPTRDLYNTDAAFAFIEALSSAGYIMAMMALVHIAALIALWTRREALAAALIAPITANVVGFHAFLDGGLITAGAGLADLMLLLNIYLLWRNREAYRSLWEPRSATQ